VGKRPQLWVLVLPVLLQGVLLLMLLHVHVLLGGRMLMFLRADNTLLLAGVLVLSAVVLLVL
jgi:hypothetical protein